MSDFEIRLLHTLVCAPPFDLLIFYFFRKRLSFRRSYVIIGYLLLLSLTMTIQMSSTLDMSMTALLCRPLALLYMTAVIRDHPLRILSIALLVYPLLLLASTLGTTMEIFFGEGLPAAMDEAMDAASRCDTVLVAGTSLAVLTGLWIVRQALANGAELVVINRGPTAVDDLAGVRVQDGTSEVLTPLAEALKA